MDGICAVCDRERTLVYRSAEGRLCQACYKRLVLRPRDPAFRERERQYAREWKARNREHNRARDREYVRAHRRQCPSCGGLMDRHSDMCQSCLVAAKEERWDTIEAMWADGALRREIAAKFGWSMNRIAVELGNMRKAGRDLPRRPPGGLRKAAA